MICLIITMDLVLTELAYHAYEISLYYTELFIVMVQDLNEDFITPLCIRYFGLLYVQLVRNTNRIPLFRYIFVFFNVIEGILAFFLSYLSLTYNLGQESAGIAKIIRRSTEQK